VFFITLIQRLTIFEGNFWPNIRHLVPVGFFGGRGEGHKHTNSIFNNSFFKNILIPFLITLFSQKILEVILKEVKHCKF
jgi:hypothetical protein